jgi:hypothetical protein
MGMVSAKAKAGGPSRVAAVHASRCWNAEVHDGSRGEAGRGVAGRVTLATYAGLQVLGRVAGTTGAERRQRLPSDELVEPAVIVIEHAIDVAGEPEEVWPWLAQLGRHLGGYYAPRWVDRLLFPGNWPSLDRLPTRGPLRAGAHPRRSRWCAGPEPGALDGLLDKSLLQRRDDAPEPRFWMLESIGDSAGEPEEGPVAVLAGDIGNLRAAVDFGLEADDTQLAREITAALGMRLPRW